MQIGLFVNAGSVTIPTGVDYVETSGYGAAGRGAASYVYDAGVSSGSRTTFVSANSRGFRLVNTGSVNVDQAGAAGDGTTDDSDAFNAATVVAQAQGVALHVSGPHIYRVRNWVVARAGGGLDIIVQPRTTLKLPDGSAYDASLLHIKADNVSVFGGQWHGNADGFDMGGLNWIIRISSEDDAAPQIANVVVEGAEFRKCNNIFAAVFGYALRNCHVRFCRFSDLAGNAVQLSSGNSAFAFLNAPTENCSIANCLGDRTMNCTEATQGMFKFSVWDALETATEMNHCHIVNCTALREVQTVDAGGSALLEIWGPGRCCSIRDCDTVGGHIGASIYFQTCAEIAGGTTRRAGAIGREIVAANSGVNGGFVDGDGVTPIGVSLDSQTLPGVTTGQFARGLSVTGVLSRGVSAVGAAVTLENPDTVSRDVIVSDCNFAFDGEAEDPIAVYALRIADLTVSNINVDGGNIAGSRALLTLACSGVASSGLTVRRMNDGVIIQHVAVSPTVTTQLHTRGVVSTDGTGALYTFTNGGGTFGAPNTITISGIRGMPFFGIVDNADLSEIDPATQYARIRGADAPYSDPATPNGSLAALKGSVITDADGRFWRAEDDGDADWVEWTA